MPTEEYLAYRRKYLENRAKFSMEELARHAGKWIAWSPDGSSIVASADDLDTLDDLIRSSRQDSTCCVVEAIPACDTVFGAGLAHAEEK